MTTLSHEAHEPVAFFPPIFLAIGIELPEIARREWVLKWK